MSTINVACSTARQYLRAPPPHQYNGRGRQRVMRHVTMVPWEKAWHGRIRVSLITRTGTITDNLTGLIWLKKKTVPNFYLRSGGALGNVASLNTNGTMKG